MDEGDPRAALAALADERGADLAALSRLIGRNPAYVQQFIRRGSPRQLAEVDRRTLAHFFGVHEHVLGGRAPPANEDEPVIVPRLDVAAAAGTGTMTDGEREAGGMSFTRRQLRDLARGGTDTLSVIRVTGTSMQPTLHEGDDILVDRGDAGAALRDGIYVLRSEGGLVVKRLAVDRAARHVRVISDNPEHPRWPGQGLSGVEVIGRVVWVGRHLG